MRKKIFSIIITFIGFILSPLTWWNDPFVNIPISYAASTVLAIYFPKLFSVSFVVFYWLTNILGIALMQIGGKDYIKTTKVNRRKQLIAIIVYTIIILALSIFEIIKPFIPK